VKKTLCFTTFFCFSVAFLKVAINSSVISRKEEVEKKSQEAEEMQNKQEASAFRSQIKGIYTICKRGMKKALVLGWLGSIIGIILPSYLGIIINHYQDPY